MVLSGDLGAEGNILLVSHKYHIHSDLNVKYFVSVPAVYEHVHTAL